MAKGVFDQEIDSMLEFDKGLDINSLLDNIPALETEKKPVETEKTPKEEKKEEPTLKNINEVLGKQSLELEKDKQKVEEEEEIIDDKVPASLKNEKTETSSDAPFTVIFARDLVAQGLLSSFDEKKFLEDSKTLGDAEALRVLIKEEIDTNINTAKTDLDAGYQDYLNLIGKGVPQETAGDLLSLKSRFDNIKADELIKEDNVELRKQVMTDYYKLTTSMTDSKISKLVQNSVDLGDDIEESKEQLGILNKLIKEQISEEETNAQAQVEASRQEAERRKEALKDEINAIDEVIPGVGINKQTKTKMYDFITKPVTDKQGRTTNAIWAKRAEDPQLFDTKLAYLLATDFFEKGKTWTKAAQAKVTKEVSELERVLKDKSNTASKTGASVIRTAEQDKTSKDNIDSMRGLFDA